MGSRKAVNAQDDSEGLSNDSREAFFRSLFSPAEIAASALCSSRAPRSLQPQAARGAKHGNSQEGLLTAGLNRLRKNAGFLFSGSLAS
jgi:hypothetical protein